MLPAPICGPILSASISALTLEQDAPLIATLHFLRDFLSYGNEYPNSSTFNYPRDNQGVLKKTEIQTVVNNLLAAQGEMLVQRIMTGMMFYFPRDCFPDASGVLLAMFELIPQQVALWIKATISMLPPGSIKAGEGDQLMNAISQKIQTGDMRKVRIVLQGEHISCPSLLYFNSVTFRLHKLLS